MLFTVGIRGTLGCVKKKKKMSLFMFVYVCQHCIVPANQTRVEHRHVCRNQLNVIKDHENTTIFHVVRGMGVSTKHPFIFGRVPPASIAAKVLWKKCIYLA